MSRKEFIPPSKTQPAKRLKLAKAKAHKMEEPPEDLIGMWTSVKLNAAIHTLLQKGSFTYDMRKVLEAGIQYIEALHKETLESCVAHPKQHLIPEIATLNAQQKVTNGEATASKPN